MVASMGGVEGQNTCCKAHHFHQKRCRPALLFLLVLIALSHPPLRPLIPPSCRLPALPPLPVTRRTRAPKPTIEPLPSPTPRRALSEHPFGLPRAEPAHSLLASQELLMERERQMLRDRSLSEMILRREHGMPSNARPLSPQKPLSRSSSPALGFASADRGAKHLGAPNRSHMSRSFDRTLGSAGGTRGGLEGTSAKGAPPGMHPTGLNRDMLLAGPRGGGRDEQYGDWQQPRAVMMNGLDLFRRS